MKVMASTTPAAMVIPTNASPRNAIGMPAIRKSSSDQVRRVNGVSTMVRAISSSRELGSDPQVITMRAATRARAIGERPRIRGCRARRVALSAILTGQT